MRKRPRICKTCRHHISIHRYDPQDEGKMPPAKCGVPGCECERYVERPGKMFYGGKR